MREELALLLIMSLLISGCSTSGNYHTITIGSGEMYVENGVFYLQGGVSVGVGAQPDVNFSDISIVLYSSNKEVIRSVEIGRLSTNPEYAPLERRVNITTKQVPEYVLIESPEFWGGKANIEVYAYQRTSDGYEEYFRSKKSQKFPTG